MYTFTDIHTALAPEIESLHACMRGALANPNPILQDIVLKNLRTKGKLIRPLIVILAAKMLGEIHENVIRMASAVELLHNASLIHDDVVDMSDERRGLPTVNAVWGNHIAVLVGDFFVSAGLRKVFETENIRVVGLFSELARNLSTGELNQIYNASEHLLTEDGYFDVIYLKTASLFVTCAQMGAYAQGVDDARTDALGEYARLLGLCFQVRDDVFDYFTDAQVGKPTGNDLREGKITLPLLHVLLTDDSPEHEAMLTLANKERCNDAEIELLLDYARRRGGIDYAYARMQEMRDHAVSLLEIFPDTAERRMLTDLFDFIIQRKY